MNFFEHQERARRKTLELGVLFGIAVLGIVLAVYAVARFTMQYVTVRGRELHQAFPTEFQFWDTQVFLVVAVVVVVFITLASLLKGASLSRGGSAVAEMLGGRLVSRDTRDLSERRLLNIVDEMAIASGVPVPQVYVLEREEGINAFAAGHTPSNAAIAVTRGTLRLLNRDELQGVIAHEFSHVLNGDMRLNIQLIGVVFGILAIGIFGRILAQGGGRGRRGGGTIALAGLALMLIGYIGTFIGRLIQSAVSRQREYLADSSAVQFTRNPRGIAGALTKIGGYVRGSRIETPKADQARHIFFSPGRTLGLFEGLMQTHPPLAERIRRIDPSFDGSFPRIAADPGTAELARLTQLAPGGVAPAHGGREALAASAPGVATAREVPVVPALLETLTRNPAGIIDRVGQPHAGHLRASAAMLAGIPAELHEALASPHSAATLMLALLLDARDAGRERQLAGLKPIMPPAEIAALLEAYPLVRSLPPQARLPLADLAMPVLRQLSESEISRLLARARLLVTIDERVTLFEFSLHWLLSYRLFHVRRRPRMIAYSRLGSVREEVLVLLAALAHADDPRELSGAQRAFSAGVDRLPELAGRGIALPTAPPGFEEVGRALHRLILASPEIKQQVIEACAYCAMADRQVTIAELELLRVVSVSLDCPLPPFLPLSDSSAGGASSGGPDAGESAAVDRHAG